MAPGAGNRHGRWETSGAESEPELELVGADLGAAAGFLNLKGNLFDSAIMKTSVISESFRARYLSNPDDPEAFEGRVVVFDGRGRTAQARIVRLARRAVEVEVDAPGRWAFHCHILYHMDAGMFREVVVS